MIMPLDIQNKKFGKSVRGYKEEEVDQFLDMITVDFEKVLDDNRLLKLKVSDLEKELEKKEAVEASVIETLASTKRLMHDISESSDKRAKILLKNAELDAQVIIREAKEKAEYYKGEIMALQARLNVFNTRYKELLGSELNKFDVLNEALFCDADASEASAESELSTGPEMTYDTDLHGELAASAESDISEKEASGCPVAEEKESLGISENGEEGSDEDENTVQQVQE